MDDKVRECCMLDVCGLTWEVCGTECFCLRGGVESICS